MGHPVWRFTDYRAFFKHWSGGLKKRSGELQKLAVFLKVHPSRLSKILKGVDPPTSEQAYLIARFIGMTETETEYLVELVNLERATNPVFKSYTRDKLEHLRRTQEGPSELAPPDRPLTQAEERIFHSSWQYMAVWLMSSVSAQNDLHSIARALKLELQPVRGVADFLVQVGLCKWNEDRLEPGARIIEFGSKSPHIESFLANWRLHALQQMPARKDGDFFYSEPMAIGAQAEREIRSLLDQTRAEIRKIIAKFPSDKVRCLNIDFFKI